MYPFIVTMAALVASEAPQPQTVCQGVPIRRFGSCWVLGEAPDLVDDASMQAGNDAPRVKVHPKASGELRRNYLGATTTRMPRSPENDYQPVEAIHLIDGDPKTCWLSHGQSRPDAQPVWIRLDLAVERPIERIVLRKRPASGVVRNPLAWGPIRDAVEVGRGMPGHLTIRVSRDSAQWETVFDGPTKDAPDKLEHEFGFAARPVKQIQIIGGNLPLVENILYAFSLAEVEVWDTAGHNVALATRGTGVSVNSTHHNPGMTLAEHRWYWPLHWDSGMKWARVGYHDDPINWHWVEKQKGVLKVDPDTDAAITELAANGVEVVMALGFGNRLYSGPAERAVPQLWEWNYDLPAPPTTPEALAAWTRYVEYMVEHFRGRVKHFEVWNEWNIGCYWGGEPNLGHYLAVARAAIPAIRRLAPEAKVMMGSWAGFPHGISSWTPAQLAEQVSGNLYLAATRELAKEVDEIGWHPFYQTDPEGLGNYTADARATLRWLESIGFRGHCMVTEWNYSAVYPPLSEAEASRAWCGGFPATELQKAKYVAQVHARHTGLGLESFFCEMYFPYFAMLDLSLLRRSFDADPISPLQPQAAYYVSRNLSTQLDGLEPGNLAFSVSPTPPRLETFALHGAEGDALLLWLGGRSADHCDGMPVDLRLTTPGSRAVAYDPLNGCRQELRVERDGAALVIRGVLARDWPLLVRLLP
ncbi:MAG: discoidin domain-containing protein [Armatimonadetes bacterium]|nr:discoidin domain-containing protein [Armatimonadota bacterium]